MEFSLQTLQLIGAPFGWTGPRAAWVVKLYAVTAQYSHDEGVCVGKGKLRVLSAFGDLAKSAQGRDGNGGFGCLVGIKFELDFHCWGQ
jgi:hypothetical protein